MDILVTYDVSTETREGRRRLRKVAQTCVDYGQRVQKSVFECRVNDVQMEKMRRRLLTLIDQEEDNLRIYRLQQPKDEFIESYGNKKIVDFDEPLVV
jgi:CRISPR-associated protein Cas2